MQISVEKKCETDVLVVGGGTAGVFAAISAAKSGASVLLIEKNSALGGTMTIGGVNFPGLFFAWGRKIIDGPCWESIQKTVEYGGATLPEIKFRPERHWHQQILLNKFIYSQVLFEMCKDSGVEFLLNTMLSTAEETKDGVSALITCKTGLISVDAKVLIDATGDANAVQILGLPTEKRSLGQPATLQNSLSGYEMNDAIAEEVKRAFPSADLPEILSPEALIAYLHKGKIDMHVPCKDADTSEGRTVLEQTAYQNLMRVYRFYRSIPELKNLEISYVAGETGVRETNRIAGEHTITAEEYISGTFYPDSICHAFYPIDMHIEDRVDITYHEENVVAKVPYRALIPKNSKRVLCAGRCISSDPYANSGLRVEATCMATGQAAGCAAAISAKNKTDVRNVPYEALCDALRTIGAIIPDKEFFHA